MTGSGAMLRSFFRPALLNKDPAIWLDEDSSANSNNRIKNGESGYQ
jgi:hypothetical protein